MRQIKEYDTADGRRFKVRYRLGGVETSETFRYRPDAIMFRDILGNGQDDRVAEALKWLKARQDDRDTLTFGQWFPLYVDQLTGVTSRTRDDYRALHRRYLSSLDMMPLAQITRTHVARLVNELDNRGLSPKTIKNAVHMLSSCLAAAMDEEHITRNPTKKVRLPSSRRDVHKIRFLTHEEFAAFLTATPEHYRPFVAFLFGTGMRWSEATAIEGRHIDFTAGTIRVDQAWKRVKGGWEIGPPKTEKSRRTINPAVLALAVAKPLVAKPNRIVFTTTTGKVIRHSNFYNRIWKPAATASGLDCSPHDARHTHASWLISDGQSLESVQDQLGHESILTTRSVYGHLLPSIGVEVGRSASAAMDRALPNGLDVGVAAVKSLPVAADQAAHPHREGADVHGGGDR